MNKDSSAYGIAYWSLQQYFCCLVLGLFLFYGIF